MVMHIRKPENQKMKVSHLVKNEKKNSENDLHKIETRFADGEY